MEYPATSVRLLNSSAPRPPILILDMMGEIEARETVNKINGKAAEMGRLLLDLKQREGWRALGYASWTQCLQCEFEYTRKHLYELMKAAPVVERLSPIGVTLNTSQALALSALEPTEQIATYKFLEQTAPDGKVSAAHIRAAATYVKEVLMTGAVDDGSGEQIRVSELVKAQITEETYERMQRQRQHIIDRGKKREYLINREPFTTNATGQVTITGLPAGAVVYVSVWTESEA